jgi:hypothetical protein
MAAKKKSPPKNPAPPKLPELPPGYTVHRSDDGWFLYVDDDLHDGIDPLPSRSAAVRAAWDDFFTHGCTRDWVAFFKAHGAPV